VQLLQRNRGLRLPQSKALRRSQLDPNHATRAAAACWHQPKPAAEIAGLLCAPNFAPACSAHARTVEDCCHAIMVMGREFLICCLIRKQVSLDRVEGCVAVE
jgi:hypothetical protein